MKTPANGKRIVRGPKRDAVNGVIAEVMESRLLMSAAALTLTDIAQFTSSTPNGSAAGLIRDASGNLYGTTTLGGANNLGAVFKVANGSGAVTTIASFTATSGCYPTGDLVMDSSGNLYGTTPYGGANGVGSVYEVASGASTVTRLTSFTSAANDVASVKLVVDAQKNLYGTTPFGGTQSQGSIFEIFNGSGAITTLASFSNGTGDNPSSGLVRDSNGNLYGTTPRNGPDGYGTIYELPFNTSSITVLAPFTSNNAPEQASAPVIDSQGNIYGTTQFGGTAGDGSVYKLSVGGSTITTLASFNSSSGANPSSAPILDASGNLFGTTPNGGLNGYGTAWEMAAGSNTITPIANFTGTNGSAGTDGFSQNAIMPGLVADGHGNYYGVAPGGAPGGLGAVYSLTPQRASQIIIAQQPPSSVSAGTQQSITLDMDTISGTIDTASHASVSLTILAGPVGGSLSGTLTTAAVNGVATLSGVVFNAVGNYTLTASSTGLTSASTTQITVTAGAASTLVISQQPTGTVAGQAIGNTIVDIEDGHGNIVTTDTSTVNVSAGNGIVLAGTTTVQAVAGVATISGLSINKAGTYKLSLTDGETASLNSSSFAITAAAASQLMVANQPAATATAGQSIGTVTVDVQDAFGNLVANNTSTLTVSTGTGGPTLTGTASKAAVAGVATFNGLSITQAGTYTLSITGAGLTGANSSWFVVNAAAASQIFVIQQPQTSTPAGQSIGTVTVSLEDKFGNTATGSSLSVTATTTSGSPAVGTTSAPAAAGVATFTGIAVNLPGTYTLTFTGSGLSQAQSNSFVITSAPASQLVITQQPSASTVAGETLGAVTVAVEDLFGNIITSDSSTLGVTLSSGAALSGTLSQTAQNGVATFGDLSVTTAGAYTLTVTDGSLTSAVTNSFNIVAAAASQLIVIQQPSAATAGKPIGSVLIQAEDAFGNLATTDQSGVTIAADTDKVLTGTTTQPDQSGVAIFSDLSISRAGNYTLTATDAALPPVTLTPITVTASTVPTPNPKPKPSPKPKPTPRHVPTPTPTPVPLQSIIVIAGTRLPTIIIDSNTDFTHSPDSSKYLNISFQSQSSGNAVILTRKFQVKNGFATIGNLRIRKAGTYTMVITDAFGSTQTQQVTIVPASPAKLQFVTEPATVDGSAPVMVEAVDAYGNLTTAADGTLVHIRLGLLPVLGRKPTFTGTTTAALTGGIATFPDISIARKGRARLVARAAKLRPVVSSIFINK